MSIGFIKLHRKLVEWEWYSDVSVCRVFIHLLITANFEDKNWRGLNIKRGQQVSSYDNLAKATNLSKQQIRTALTKLKSTHELTITSTSHYTIFTLTNYTLYQDRKNDSNTPSTHGATNEQQTSNIPSTTTKEIKEIKEDKNLLFSQFEKIYRLYNQGKNLKIIPFDKLKTRFQLCLKEVTFEELEDSVNDYLAYLATSTWRKKKAFDAWINSSEFYANDWKEESSSIPISHDPIVTKLNSIAGDNYFKSVTLGDTVIITCNDGMKTKAYNLSDLVKSEIKAQFKQSIKID